MQKIFLILSCLFILAGCTGNISTSQPIVPTPEITVHTVTGRLLVDTLDTILPGEYGFVIDKETGFKFSYITGYSYTYTYSDLGYTITTSWGYDTSSYILFTGSLLARSGTLIHNAQLPMWVDYFALENKDPSFSLLQTITQLDTADTCILLTGVLDATTTYYESMIGFDVVYVEDKYPDLRCRLDTMFPERIMPIVFVMDPKRPSTYYTLAMNEACAPGPCTVFGDITFF